MTDVHEAAARVERSQEYARLLDELPGAYLAHAFCHIKHGGGGLELGYYSEATDSIVVFTTSPLSRRAPEPVFKEGGTVERLGLERVAIGLAEARAIAEKHREQKYPYHPCQQEICILQSNLPVWTITLITSTFHTLRLRVDASTGHILEEDLRNLLDLR